MKYDFLRSLAILLTIGLLLLAALWGGSSVCGL